MSALAGLALPARARETSNVSFPTPPVKVPPLAEAMIVSSPAPASTVAFWFSVMVSLPEPVLTVRPAAAVTSTRFSVLIVSAPVAAEPSMVIPCSAVPVVVANFNVNALSPVMVKFWRAPSVTVRVFAIEEPIPADSTLRFSMPFTTTFAE